MSHHPSSSRRLSALLLAAMTGVIAPAAVSAQSAESAAAPGLPAAPTPNATVNLIRLMVERGLLPAADAAKLVQQAEAEAAQARAALASPPPAAPLPEGTVRVTYIPASVKRQMVEEVHQQVVQDARENNWPAQRSVPDWVSRYRVSGDLRFRYEGDYFPDGGVPGGTIDFNKINTSAPVDYFSAGSIAQPPAYNADQGRERFRFRARLGAEIDVGEGMTSGLRLATGESNSPVSQNQSFGASGGNFSKYSLWLDRAFLKYETSSDSGRSFRAVVGRMDNPFFATSMIWSNDLGFDGLVLDGKYKLNDKLAPFFTVGALPVYNTSLNFGTDSAASSGGGRAYASRDKWLYAAQTGVTWKIAKDLTAKAAVALYDFENVEGQVSAPIDATTLNTTSGFSGSTDSSRPGFAQKGNTYIALRELTNSTLPGAGNFQYFGLATPFRELAATARLDYNHFEPFQISLIGEMVTNLAFNKGDIIANGPSQLPGPRNNNSAAGAFQGGNLGWTLNLQVGAAALQKRWDWSAGLGYRYVESDSVVDGFADSDFGGGGTNLQGYTLSGNLALSKNVWLGARWMSATSIAGDTFKADVLQLDLNAKF
jgi:Putative porin